MTKKHSLNTGELLALDITYCVACIELQIVRQTSDNGGEILFFLFVEMEPEGFSGTL